MSYETFSNKNLIKILEINLANLEQDMRALDKSIYNLNLCVTLVAIATTLLGIRIIFF